MLIQIHVLQNYAPSNLNRDDTGAPKDAVFGGVRRGRISSQCLKRSIRHSSVFVEAFKEDGLLGMRTRKVPTLVREELVRMGVVDPALSEIVSKTIEIGRESGKGNAGNGGDNNPEPSQEEPTEKDEQVKQLIFVGKNEIEPMAKKLLEIYNRLGSKGWKSAKIAEITKELGSSVPRSVDIAMFGRMTTSEAFEDVSAAVQVAHAISTNMLDEEFDYFTAVDDISDEKGAGMIGDVEFNSSTYYKYFNIHWEELLANLGGNVEVAKKSVLAFIEAVVTAQPSGKQNTFAAFNLPDLVLVEVTDRNLPVSYANAFLKPVRPTHEVTLMEGSIRQLGEYMSKVNQVYDIKAQRAYVSLDDAKLPASDSMSSISSMKEWLEKLLPQEA